MPVYLVISRLKTPYINRIYLVLANPTLLLYYCRYTAIPLLLYTALLLYYYRYTAIHCNHYSNHTAVHCNHYSNHLLLYYYRYTAILPLLLGATCPGTTCIHLFVPHVHRDAVNFVEGV
jgi:hypothetical protein